MKLGTYPKQTHWAGVTHIGCWHRIQTRCCSSIFRVQDSHQTQGHIHSSSWAGRGRRLVVQQTHHSPQVHKHVDTHRFLKHHVAPLPTWHLWWDYNPLNSPHGSLRHQLVHLGAHCTNSAFTHSSHGHPSIPGPLKYQHRPSTYLIGLPEPGVDPAWSSPTDPHAHLVHNQLGR